MPLRRLHRVPIHFRAKDGEGRAGARVLVSTKKCFFQGGHPRFFCETTIPREVTFFRTTMGFHVRVTMHIRLNASTHASYHITPRRGGIAVFGVYRRETVVHSIPVMIRTRVEATISVVHVRKVHFPINIQYVLKRDTIVGRASLFVVPQRDGFHSFFRTKRAMLPIFLCRNETHHRLPPLFFRHLSRLRRAPGFMRFIYPLPLRLVRE